MEVPNWHLQNRSNSRSDGDVQKRGVVVRIFPNLISQAVISSCKSLVLQADERSFWEIDSAFQNSSQCEFGSRTLRLPAIDIFLCTPKGKPSIRRGRILRSQIVILNQKTGRGSPVYGENYFTIASKMWSTTLRLRSWDSTNSRYSGS